MDGELDLGTEEFMSGDPLKDGPIQSANDGPIAKNIDNTRVTISK
jgi:hypothetical protein